MTLEALWYETSPVVYLLSGSIASLYDSGPLMMKLSGLLLAMTAITILGLRLVSRRPRPDVFDEHVLQHLREQDLFLHVHKRRGP